MPHMPEIDVACYLPSAPAFSDYEGVLLCARNGLSVSRFRNTVLRHQPFSGCEIHERQVDVASVLSAEVLERSVGNKRIQEFELSPSNQSLSVLDRDAQELGRSFPGIGILFDNGGPGPVDVSVISRRVVLLVQLGQGTPGDAKIANSQHAGCDQVSEPCTAHAQEFPKTTLRPPILDSRAHSQSPQTEAHGTDRTTEALGNLGDRLIAGQIQEFVIVLVHPGT